MDDGVCCEVLGATQDADEDVFRGDLLLSVMFKFVNVELTYVEIDSHRHDKSGQRKTIADFLHEISCGAKRWRCNIIATIVVHNDTHDKVDASSDTTA